MKAGRSLRQEIDLIGRGEMRLVGLIPRASNYTFLAEVSEGSQRVRVVYKPRTGEAPLWDFPDGTLCNREVGAYVLARALGWPSVPPTVMRDGPHGEGAVQLFVDADPSEHFFTLRETRADDFRRFAAFDVIVNNADRKSGHCLLGPDGTIWAIDHGVCFSVHARLRTVIWDFADKPVPAEVLDAVRRVTGELRSGGLREEMLVHLSEEEIDATADRAEILAESGRFPTPDPGRAYPWPPV
ncbi:MAG TPA: SCO1664 family protein [Actinomycetota bacterium]|nr:SCO1664 family protein [Actinomycetota bacterium]